MTRRKLHQMLACPVCDLLQRHRVPPPGEIARCPRCHTIVLSNKRNVIDRMLAAAVSTAILMIAAVFFPFLSLERSGLSHEATVLDALAVFSEGWTAPLTIAVTAFIVIIPVTRAAALCYTLLPLRLGYRPGRWAAASFRFAMALKPWAMAEIFIVGVVVALVKIVDIAEVSLGPAFWAFAAMVVLVILEESALCKWTIWRLLDPAR